MGRWRKDKEGEVKMRECLRCEKKFKSRDNSNRLCPHCGKMNSMTEEGRFSELPFSSCLKSGGSRKLGPRS